MSQYQNSQPVKQHYVVENCAPKNGERVYSMLAYIGVLWIAGLLAEKNNSKVRFHVNQGVLLTVVYVAVGMAASLLGTLFTAILWQVGSVISKMFSIIIWVTYFLFVAIGMRNVWKGEEAPLPFIGKLFTLIK